MELFRITYGEGDDYTISTYHTSLESARAALVKEAQEAREDGEPYWEYTWRRVERLVFSPAGTAHEDGWGEALNCRDLTDLFPAPRKNSDGIYEDEDDYWEDGEDEADEDDDWDEEDDEDEED